jgi:single-stranded-DNA-specific exonuclease
VLADLVHTREPVLAVVADVARRRAGIAERLGGFGLCAWAALERDPGLVAPYRHVVALDPPPGPPPVSGGGFLHLAWGEEELRFAQRMLELEHDLRAPLAALFRALRGRGWVSGEELEAALRGGGQHGRSPAAAGRLVRVLRELGLVELERDPPALAVASERRTELARSPTWRAAQRRLQDGRRFLSSATAPRAA